MSDDGRYQVWVVKGCVMTTQVLWFGIVAYSMWKE